MSRFVPVSFEKWAEMVKAQSDLVRYKEICDELDAECTRLKDENARLRSFCTRTIIPNIDLEKEVTRLKAEVERLEALKDACKRMIKRRDKWIYEHRSIRKQLEAEIERLNSLCDCLGIGGKHTITEIEAENARLKAEVERLTKQNALATPRHLIASQDIKTLREQVERLTKAVMHSPAAQLKLKELEGKTTFDEINPDNQ